MRDSVVSRVTCHASRAQQPIDGFVRKLIRALVARMAGVTFHPMPFNRMSRDLGIQRLPKIHVLHGLFIRRAPVAFLPLMNPFGNSLSHVLRIGVKLHVAVSRQRREGSNRSRKFHSIVGGQRFAAVQLFTMRSVHQECAPTTRTRIAATRAIGVDGYRGHGLWARI